MLITRDAKKMQIKVWKNAEKNAKKKMNNGGNMSATDPLCIPVTIAVPEVSLSVSDLPEANGRRSGKEIETGAKSNGPCWLVPELDMEIICTSPV